MAPLPPLKTPPKDTIETHYHLGNNDGSITFEREQDCQPIIDEVQKIKQVTDGRSKTGDLVHVGRIPAVIVEKYCNSRGITFHDFIVDDTHVTALMNDSDYRVFRVWEGIA